MPSNYQIPRHVLLSRTDSIGDVVLSLPVAAMLKRHAPDTQVHFLGTAYTQPVIEACVHVDAFVNRDAFLQTPTYPVGTKPDAILHLFPVAEIAQRAARMNIPLRVGTTNRLYHWNTCNRLLLQSRKRSARHEAQLNLDLLRPLGIQPAVTKEELAHCYGLERLASLSPETRCLLDPKKYSVILHPGSQGSAREWGLVNYIHLARLLDPDVFQVFIFGVPQERDSLNPLFRALGDTVVDMLGRLALAEYIAFIAACDGLVACSTGPLHLAAALGKDAFGIYAPLRFIHPWRWGPLGSRAQVFMRADREGCRACQKRAAACDCIQAVQPAQIAEALNRAAQAKTVVYT